MTEDEVVLRPPRSDKVRHFFGDENAQKYVDAKAAQSGSQWYLRPLYMDDELTSEADGTVKAGTLRALVERLTLDAISEVSYLLDPRGEALMPHAYRSAAGEVLPTDFLPDLPYICLRRRGLLLAHRTIRNCSSRELDRRGAGRLEGPQAEARTEPRSDLLHDMAGGPRDAK
jgi:hypothetical protein